MDFKGWKKIKEDKDTTTMMHDKGHMMTLANKAMPKIQREQLKRLPIQENGGVKFYDTGDYVEPADSPANQADNETNKRQQVSKSYKAATVQPSEGPSLLDRARSLLNPSAEASTPQSNARGGQIQHFDQGTPNQPISAASQQAATPINVQSPNIPQTNPAVLLPNGSMSAPGVAQAGQQGLSEQQQIEAAQSPAKAEIEQARIQAEQQQAQQNQDNINMLRNHADSLANTIKTVDPDAYRKNMSSPEKVSTALGLMLGGFSTPFGGTNFTADFLNKQIDRDIAAQQQNNENKKTIWGAYNSLYGNQVLANSMAKASMADIYTAQLGKLAAQFGTAQSLANYHKGAADLAAIKNKAILEAAGNLSSTPNNPSKNAPAIQSAPQAQAPVPANQNPSSPPPQANEAPAEQEGLLSQFIHGRLGAPTQSQASIPKENEETPEKQPIYHILTPDAEQKLHGEVQYGAPGARADYPSVLDQFTKAQQAEKVLNGPNGDGVNGIHDLMQRMYANTGSGSLISGIGPHVRNSLTGALGAIPEVGPALVGASRMVPRTAAQKDFDSNKSVMETDLANALQGLVAPTDIQRIVDANLPAYGDSKKDIERKTQAIVNMVIKGAKTSQLQSYKMTGK